MLVHLLELSLCNACALQCSKIHSNYKSSFCSFYIPQAWSRSMSALSKLPVADVLVSKSYNQACGRWDRLQPELKISHKICSTYKWKMLCRDAILILYTTAKKRWAEHCAQANLLLLSAPWGQRTCLGIRCTCQDIFFPLHQALLPQGNLTSLHTVLFGLCYHFYSFLSLSFSCFLPAWCSLLTSHSICCPAFIPVGTIAAPFPAKQPLDVVFGLADALSYLSSYPLYLQQGHGRMHVKPQSKGQKLAGG